MHPCPKKTAQRGAPGDAMYDLMEFDVKIDTLPVRAEFSMETDSFSQDTASAYLECVLINGSVIEASCFSASIVVSLEKQAEAIYKDMKQQNKGGR
jgi:hypothetical protein